LVNVVSLLVIWYEILNRFPALWFVLLAPFKLLCPLVLLGLIAKGTLKTPIVDEISP
jgi:hypothetical protein